MSNPDARVKVLRVPDQYNPTMRMRRIISRWAGRVVFYVPTASKTMSVSFDDGPTSPCTGRVLDVLDKHNVKATFFMMGRCVERDPALAREVAARGHTVGSHSHYHQGMGMFSEADAEEAIKRSRNLIVDATGQDTHLFRPPYGAMNDEVRAACVKNGIVVAGWTFSSGDWYGYGQPRIASRMAKMVCPGTILLFHDGDKGRRGADRPMTPGGLDQTLDFLLSEGWSCVDIPCLLDEWSKPMCDFGSDALLLGMSSNPCPGGEPGVDVHLFWDTPKKPPRAYSVSIGGTSQTAMMPDPNDLEHRASTLYFRDVSREADAVQVRVSVSGLGTHESTLQVNQAEVSRRV